MIHSQGDQTGGGIIAWQVIGGPRHRGGRPPATGQTYEFSVDYSQLGKDPKAAVSAAAGRFMCRPGGILLADWT